MRMDTNAYFRFTYHFSKQLTFHRNYEFLPTFRNNRFRTIWMLNNINENVFMAGRRFVTVVQTNPVFVRNCFSEDGRFRMIIMRIPNVYIELSSNFDMFTNFLRLVGMIDNPAAQNTRRTVRRAKCFSRLSPFFPFSHDCLRHDLT